jgi:ribosomal protein S18 acetylase RimI-like enzyme
MILGILFQMPENLGLYIQKKSMTTTHQQVNNINLISIENNDRYIIRDIKYADLHNIRLCNERNLPETYDGNFYVDQMSHWPQLSLALCTNEKAIGNTKSSQEGGVNEVIVGYVLVRTTDLLESFQGQYIDNRRAVVISIAVDQKHRGRGLAQTLLNSMHSKIICHYPDINIVELNCRVSENNYYDRSTSISVYVYI